MKLTIKQQRFADEYIISGNATQAAIKAGYSERSASRMAGQNMKKHEIHAYIDQKLQELYERNIMRAEEALSILSEIARGEREEEVVTITPSGEIVRTTRKADHVTVIKAIGELLKRYPTAKQGEKLQLEIERLKKQLEDESAALDDTVVTGFTFDRSGQDDDA